MLGIFPNTLMIQFGLRNHIDKSEEWDVSKYRNVLESSWSSSGSGSMTG